MMSIAIHRHSLWAKCDRCGGLDLREHMIAGYCQRCAKEIVDNVSENADYMISRIWHLHGIIAQIEEEIEFWRHPLQQAGLMPSHLKDCAPIPANERDNRDRLHD
jgi:hypothetical protein